MIEKYLIPDKNEISINLPSEYIGKTTHLLIDIVDRKLKKPSDYLGSIDEETAKEFKKHLKKIKKNWE